MNGVGTGAGVEGAVGQSVVSWRAQGFGLWVEERGLDDDLEDGGLHLKLEGEDCTFFALLCSFPICCLLTFFYPAPFLFITRTRRHPAAIPPRIRCLPLLFTEKVLALYSVFNSRA